MKYMLSLLIIGMVLSPAFGSPTILPSTSHQFAEFKKEMIPMYGSVLTAIDAKMPFPRDPQLKLRRRDIDGLLDAIRSEVVPKISRRLEKETDLGAFSTEFEWLSDLVVEFEIQINRYVRRAVAVGELRLDLGLHEELERFAAFSSSYRHAFGSGYRQEYRRSKAKEPFMAVWGAVDLRSPLTIILVAGLAALIAIWMASRLKHTSK